MCTPPDKEGKVYPTTLVAAKEAGVDVIYKVGGVRLSLLWHMEQNRFLR